MMQRSPSDFLSSPIEFLTGVGPVRAEVLRQELKIFTFRDLLFYFPFRHIDKSHLQKIRDLNASMDSVLVKGTLSNISTQGDNRKKRLAAVFRDETGFINLIWFQGIKFLEGSLQIGKEYVLYGKLSSFKGQWTVSHPELELVQDGNNSGLGNLDPVYSSTEKSSAKGLDAKGIRKLVRNLLEKIKKEDIPETLPKYLIEKLKFVSRASAVVELHFPKGGKTLEDAKNRLKFEELFFLQLRLNFIRQRRQKISVGYPIVGTGDAFKKFFHEKLPFELTNAQKRVVREIFEDMKSGKQMNRLLQGDVGSGKTMVALLAMLMAVGSGFQTVLLAPTEILATQHFDSISDYLKGTGVQVAFLSGSTPMSQRKQLFPALENGVIPIIVGTHALLEEKVVFKNLGLAITDEQHRFGVEQRASLWAKAKPLPPHVLVMTATPIPRTLAMTLYGDLEVSIIDELPPGRKEISTHHYFESKRLLVQGLMKREIDKGRQVYIVFPLIEESEKLDLLDLQAGYDALIIDFPRPKYQISILHGRMKSSEKEAEMNRFVKGETQIMVATTVIEVGVNVPNASVMIIENAERFGLSQLHQLRGRVGRGAEQSYCILMSGNAVSKEGLARLRVMESTNDGFKIAEEDLKLRGPGDMEGTAQSGLMDLNLSDLVKDEEILLAAREIAKRILEKDPDLNHDANVLLKKHIEEKGRMIQLISKVG
jgi:ATP-dependent DNA helicase RecG